MTKRNRTILLCAVVLAALLGTLGMYGAMQMQNSLQKARMICLANSLLRAKSKRCEWRLG